MNPLDLGKGDASIEKECYFEIQFKTTYHEMHIRCSNTILIQGSSNAYPSRYSMLFTHIIMFLNTIISVLAVISHAYDKVHLFYNMHPLKKPKALLLQQSEIDESPNSQVDSDYINHLKTQCAIRYNALKTAENLISAYQKENDSLKAENHSLKERLQVAQEKLQKMGGSKMEVPEKVQYFQRINELLERIIEKDQRIADLQREARIMQEKMAKEGKTREERRQREGRQKQPEERDKYSNFLRTPIPQDTFSSIGSRSSYQKPSMHILQAEVKKKDTEILALLRRLRDVEEELKSRGKKERLKTSDTLVNKSMRKNTYSSIDEN